MKGKGIMVANQNWYDGYKRTFSKKKCPGCREIEEYFSEHKDSRSCECMDCGNVLLNENHGIRRE